MGPKKGKPTEFELGDIAADIKRRRGEREQRERGRRRHSTEGREGEGGGGTQQREEREREEEALNRGKRGRKPGGSMQD